MQRKQLQQLMQYKVLTRSDKADNCQWLRSLKKGAHHDECDEGMHSSQRRHSLIAGEHALMPEGASAQRHTAAAVNTIDVYVLISSRLQN